MGVIGEYIGGSGGGGSITGALIPLHQDSLGLIILGKDSASANPQDTTKVETTGNYGQNPSVLRWLWEEAIGSPRSPYADSNALPLTGIDPDPEIVVNQDKLTFFENSIKGINAEEDIKEFLTSSLSDVSDKFTSLNLSEITDRLSKSARDSSSLLIESAFSNLSNYTWETFIDTSIASFRNREVKNHELARAQLNGRFSDSDTVQSSAFLIANSILESDFNDRLATYDSEVSINLAQLGFSSFINSFSNTLRDYIGTNIEAIRTSVVVSQDMSRREIQGFNYLREVSELQAQINRLKWMVKEQEQDVTIGYEVADTLWDIDLFQRAANVVSAASGGVVAKSSVPNRGQSILGSAAIGASLGIEATGTSQGAGIGALIGAGAGILGNV